MEDPARTIMHADLDAFFASVEQRDHPELRGKALIVGGTQRRGVVCAASYEARHFGVRSAMPMIEAMRRCPHAIVMPPSMGKYSEASTQFFGILRDYSPVVEGLSIDEGFVDLTGCERLLGPAPKVAEDLRARVARELELTVSVGLAPAKFVAKMASEFGKPNGLFVVPEGGVIAFLHPLPVERLWGVGPKTRERLRELGLKTIGDIARFPKEVLTRKLGAAHGEHLHRLALGIDERNVVVERKAVSLGHEETFERDLTSADDLEPILLHQADRVASRLRRRGVHAKTVVLKLKTHDFELRTRQCTLKRPSSDGVEIGNSARQLLHEIDRESLGALRIRLCGVSVKNLVDHDEHEQLDLYAAMSGSDVDEAPAAGTGLGNVLDQIHARFGAGSLGRAIYQTERSGPAAIGPRSARRKPDDD